MSDARTYRPSVASNEITMLRKVALGKDIDERRPCLTQKLDLDCWDENVLEQCGEGGEECGKSFGGERPGEKL